MINPPKYGNCTVKEKNNNIVISVADIKEVYMKNKKETATATTKSLDKLKKKLEHAINYTDHEVDEVIEHDYFQSPVVECIIYYVTGSYTYFNYICYAFLYTSILINSI